MVTSSRMWRHVDTWLLAAVVLVTFAGVAMIRSAIGGNVNLANLVPRQAVYALVGLALLVIFAAIDYRIWSALTRPLYVLIVAALALIVVAGFVGFGSARWFNVGIAYIQPSELAKVLVTLVLANFIARNEDKLGTVKTFLGSLALVALPVILVFIQPNLSTAIVLAVIWVALVWASGMPLKLLVILGGVGLFLPFATWPLLRDYQRLRVINFLFPNPEKQYGATYNVNQSLISIGSGGLFGQGYGHGTQVQLRFLKVRHTDFIFSALGEEFGFVGAVLLVLLFMFIIYRCLKTASIARDKFGALICYGVAIMLLFQGGYNIGVNLSLFPVSGLPLPFFSYGGSSLVANLICIGLVESVALRHKQIEL